MARFDQINHPPQRLADDVYDQLQAAILGGIIQPGERLIQEQLAEEMSVSRTPVREALLRLEEEGIIEPAATRGFVLVEVTEDTIRSLYESRQAVEGFAARIVAESAPDERIEALRLALGHEIDMSEPTAFEENRLAHRAVMVASANDMLLEMLDSLFSKARSIRSVYNTWAAGRREGEIMHTHQALFEAIASRDGSAAEAAMLEHLDYGLQEMLRTLGEMQAARR